METPNPIFEKDNLWYFYDETWANYHGPYNSKAEAKVALNRYCEEVLGR